MIITDPKHPCYCCPAPEYEFLSEPKRLACQMGGTVAPDICKRIWKRSTVEAWEFVEKVQEFHKRLGG